MLFESVETTTMVYNGVSISCKRFANTDSNTVYVQEYMSRFVHLHFQFVVNQSCCFPENWKLWTEFYISTASHRIDYIYISVDSDSKSRHLFTIRAYFCEIDFMKISSKPRHSTGTCLLRRVKETQQNLRKFHVKWI